MNLEAHRSLKTILTTQLKLGHPNIFSSFNYLELDSSPDMPVTSCAAIFKQQTLTDKK